MSHPEKGIRIATNPITRWIFKRWIPVSMLMLTAFTLILGALSTFWRRLPERLDPQSQVGVSWLKPAGSEKTYAGNEACRSCHAREFKLYDASPHAHTVRWIPPGEELPEFSSKDTTADDRQGIIYTVQKANGENQVVARTGTNVEVASARWEFGAGTQARSYLDQIGPNFLELRYSYFPPADMWSFTPGDSPGQGFHQALGIPYNATQMAACFGCHSTVLTGTRKALDLAHSILNVGCESCHGPCRSHVESASGYLSGTPGHSITQTAMVTPAKRSNSEIMQICSTCHRFPIVVTNENSASEPELARFAGVALPRSRCFIESSGKMSCVTCHDPHQSTKQQQESSFELKCISCHNQAHGTSCDRGESTGCISCHMPLQQIARKTPMSFHNHWIRKNLNG